MHDNQSKAYMTNPYLRRLPLYDNLSRELETRMSKGNFSLPNDFNEYLSTALTSLNKEQAEQVVLLITHYYFLTNSDNPFTAENCNPKQKGKSRLPYGMKIGPSGKGLSLNLNAIPPAFLALLGIYCRLDFY